MGYYNAARGDYRTYGYGRGDPGFLSSLWKGVKKIAGPVLGGLIGGPIGAVVGGLGGGGGGGYGTPPIVAAKPTPQFRTQLGPFQQTSFYPPVPRMPGGASLVPTAHERMASASAGMGGAGCPRGYHLAKDGSGRWVRNRRMNIANPRALRRAMRRVQGFEKMAKRTITFTKRVRMKK